MDEVVDKLGAIHITLNFVVLLLGIIAGVLIANGRRR